MRPFRQGTDAPMIEVAATIKNNPFNACSLCLFSYLTTDFPRLLRLALEGRGIKRLAVRGAGQQGDTPHIIDKLHGYMPIAPKNAHT